MPSFLRLLCLFAALLTGCSKKPAPSTASAASSSPSSAPPASTTAASPSATQVLRLSQRNEPGDLDPATATLPDEFALLRALSEGLLIPGPAGSDPLPGAATRFEVSGDGLMYTFHLRPNAVWSNGDPVTAADFVASYRRLLTPATAAPKANVFFPVKNARAFVSGQLSDFAPVGIQSPDAHTLVITLTQPNPRFPHYVASGPWLPIHPSTVAKHGRKWTAPGNFVGNGPFVLTEWRPHQRIVVKKNPRWHGAASVRLGEIQFLHFDNGDAEDRAYRAGQIDATMAVPNSKLDVYATERAAELHRVPMIETRYLTFNTKHPALSDVRVRRALIHALDRATLAAKVTRGGQEPAASFLPSTLPLDAATRHEPLAAFPFDPASARRLLAEAGFPEGKGFPKLELTGWANNPILEAVQQMWRQHLGIEVAILVREGKVHQASLQAGTYDIGFIWEIPEVADATALLGGFVTGSPDNYPQWSDPAYDALLQRLVTTAAPADRARLQLEAAQHLILSAPIAPLYYNTKIWLMSPRLRGWQEDGLWTRNYQAIHFADP